MLKAIVCVSYDEKDKNNPYSWGIGKNNSLLFNIKQDMRFFREHTIGKTVVMGYNTLLSMPDGQPLKNRTTIVLCPDGVDPEGCIVFHDFSRMLQFVRNISLNDDVYVCGGGMMYNSMNDYCDEVLVTKVYSIDTDATVFYPNLDATNSNKVCIYESDLFEENEYKFRFTTYKTIKQY